MKITGAAAMVECLRQEDVRVVFGYPGATIAPFYDSLAGCGEIRHILTRTEQGAGHGASGYARVSGRPGVCVATSGPGATNLFTALATAYSDSIPLVAITGQVATHQLGRDVFQEVDTTGAAEPFTKYTYLVKDAADLGRVFREAFHIANTGRKGPVVIDVPVDVQQQTVHFTYPESIHIRGYKPRYEGHGLQVKRVAEALKAAKRPLICCGGGVLLADACTQIRELCEKGGIPAVSTMMGIGAMPPEHPLCFGMLGSFGMPAANAAVEESDLLVFVGVRVGDRAITRPGSVEAGAAIVHIDIDTAEIGKNMGATIPLVGDAARVLEQLLEKKPYGKYGDWVARLTKLREAWQPPAAGEGVEPNLLVRRLCEKLSADSVYVADVGLNQIWSARNYTSRGRFLTTGGMGTMGYSLPAAVGAKLAAPERTVVAVCGDGAFQMTMNELATMRQHGAPVKIVLMRNGVLGMVREIQDTAYHGNRYAVDLSGSPDFSLIAAAYGVRHLRIDKAEQVVAAVDMLLEDGAPCILECVVDAKEGTA